MNIRILPLFTVDVLGALVALYAVSAVMLRSGIPVHLDSVNLTAGLIGAFLAVILTASFFLEIYSDRRRYRSREIGLRILMLVVMSFFSLTLFYLAGSLSYPQWIQGGTALVCFGVMQFAWHSLYRRIPLASCQHKKVLVVGSGGLAQQMGQLVDEYYRPGNLLGYIQLGSEMAQVESRQVVGTEKNLIEQVQHLAPDQIVVALSERRGVFPLKELLGCKLSGIEVLDAPTFYEQTLGKLLIENITPGWFIFADGFKVTPFARVAKRVMDVSCALIGLALTLPLFPVLALLIKMDSDGPVFFSQTRVGEGDKEFTILKFRTMRKDAEARTGAVWSPENDPRITPLGHFLRKSRLDEIPQLLNVLAGDMSMVGPRPERPEFVTKLKKAIPYYSERHYVKPGVTGWAQVLYPYGASEQDAVEKLRYDLYYIKNMSILMDINIILKTVHVVLFNRGGR